MNREKSLETILAILVGLVLAHLLLGSRWFLIAALVLGVIGLFAGRLASKITRLWLKLAEIMGLVVSRVVLSAVFFGFLLPIAILSRMSSRSAGFLR